MDFDKLKQNDTLSRTCIQGEKSRNYTCTFYTCTIMLALPMTKIKMRENCFLLEHITQKLQIFNETRSAAGRSACGGRQLIFVGALQRPSLSIRKTEESLQRLLLLALQLGRFPLSTRSLTLHLHRLPLGATLLPLLPLPVFLFIR